MAWGFDSLVKQVVSGFDSMSKQVTGFATQTYRAVTTPIREVQQLAQGVFHDAVATVRSVSSGARGLADGVSKGAGNTGKALKYAVPATVVIVLGLSVAVAYKVAKQYTGVH